MREIEAEHTKFIYFTRADGLPGTRVMGLHVRGLDPFMQRRVQNSSDFRLVLMRNVFSPDAADVYYLHWNDGQNLNALDIKVEQGTFSDSDFELSVKTVYQRTQCPKCHLWWDTLVIPPGDPYLGAPGLLEKKVAMRSGSYNTCPNCGASLRQLVVKIF